MRPVVLVLLLASAGHAAPLRPLWRAPGCGLIQRRSADTLYSVDQKQARLVRIALRDGKALPPLPLALPGKGAYVAAVLGDTVVVKSEQSYVGVDGATGKERWRSATVHPEWPYYAAIDRDLVVAHPGAQGIVVERLDGATGKPRWTTPTPPIAADVHWLAGDRQWVFVAFQAKGKKRYVIHALDAADGHVLWSTTLPIKAYLAPVLSGRDVAVPDNGDGLRVLDASTGQERFKLSHPNMRALVLAEGRMFLLQPGRPAGLRDEIVAIDLATQAPLWTFSLVNGQGWLHGATAEGVVVGDGNAILRQLDLTTGRRIASHGAPDRQNVEVSPALPMVTLCDGEEVVALDPTGDPDAHRTTTVRGVLECRRCGKRKLHFRIGDAEGFTDPTGQLEIAVGGTGRFALETKLEGRGWSRTKVIIVPDGASVELGTVSVEPEVDGD